VKNHKLTFVLVVILFIALIVVIGLGWFAFNSQAGQTTIMKDEQTYLAKKLSRHSNTLEELSVQLKDIERMIQQDRTQNEGIVNKVAIMADAIESWSVAVDEMESKISNSEEVIANIDNEIAELKVEEALEVDLGAVSINKGADTLELEEEKL